MLDLTLLGDPRAEDRGGLLQRGVDLPGDHAVQQVRRVIVEADYRMKLIGIGRLDGGKDIRSFFDLLPKNQQQNPPTLDALRWWLTMKRDGGWDPEFARIVDAALAELDDTQNASWIEERLGGAGDQ